MALLWVELTLEATAFPQQEAQDNTPHATQKRLESQLPQEGDTNQQEMVSTKKSAVLVDGVILNGPTTDAKAGEKFVEEACRLIMEEVVLKATDVNEKVCEWQPPEQLKQLLDLEMRDTGEPHHRLLKLCRDVIHYSVKTSGSVSNMYAMNLARYKYCPDIKEKGLSGLPRLILFTSAECHYSMKKAASFLGIGTENICFVETDGRCTYFFTASLPIPAVLIAKGASDYSPVTFQQGAAPFLVSATSGTTVLGAFDPLDEIADVCERHGLWLHVDASWGGSALMSRKHRRLLQGIHRADSVAWNPHKMLMAGIQCCALLVKDKSGLLKKCYSAKASYLFQQDKFYDVSYDTGDKSIQCSRRADAFKFWMTWKALGTLGLEERVNRALALSRYLVEEIKKREGFKLLMEVAPAIKERMMKKGSLMLGYQPHRGKVNFFRQVVISPQVSREDMDFLLDEIDLLGRDM
ncbi:Glutamate decarboxylase-like protein 1 [Myotis brandtii]|uniref:Glutamate decarboxylase-like protein 1 n=1 Tax=Myotis brandtii TaxID=109478 RepID=S7ND31_MYOBR|nr:Glutamate decarboxylase-like protein 1 [Myotis brandtii]